MSGVKIYFLFLVVTLAFSCSSKEEQKMSERPNIIFIMADDHAYQAISAYGEGLNETPNIDRIAKEGAIFTRATVTNSICAPSRAVLLTGKHSFMNGKVDNIQPFDWDQDNFPKLMQANGYTTALIGKIHLDGQPQGFDYSMVLPGQGEYYNPDFLINGEKKRIEGYVTDITTDLALDWLENGRDKEKPFVLLYHQKAPHRNWKPAPEYLTLYDDKEFTPPANFFDEETNYQGRGSAAREQKMEIDEIMRWGRDLMLEVNPNGDSTGLAEELKRFNPEQLKAWREAFDPKNAAFLKAYGQLDENTLTLEKKREIATWKYNRYIKNYLRTIKSVDDGVGEVLDYLEANGLAENTIVVYTSDQGFYLGEHGWFDKRFMYEESFRTPLLVKYPKEIKPGTTIKNLVQNLDFAPTFLDYAGIKAPAEMQGESFRKLVSGESKEWRDAVYYTYYEYPAEHSVKRHNGVATDRYKLIHFYYDIDEWELYDLETDPHEMQNVYDDPAYAEVREMMHKKFVEVREKYGDSDANDKRFLDEYMEVYNKRNSK
ncbi:sulfatase [Algoriphagus aquimarinus]|uniref:Sulfatase n=1 Tax=Algoriphagus aquimarinus TaxID=237018 RepID=A0A5C7AX87_9BACT|nr:sulfatase [Algoriphagus aquimarinus]TXE11145.1 sulfatase [Algoriphagus aquimarinus]